MNQHVRLDSDRQPAAPAPERFLRLLAASMSMHFFAVHRLTPPQTTLSKAFLVHNMAQAPLNTLTMGDLLPHAAGAALMVGPGPVEWRIDDDKAHRFGRLPIRAGITVALHNAYGTSLGLTLCDAEARLVQPDHDRLLARGLTFLAGIAAEEIGQHDVTPPVSRRERACLQWAAAGKTSIETAMILGLSPHTVNQHLTQAAGKLDAVNRAHAISKAIRLGLLDLTAV